MDLPAGGGSDHGHSQVSAAAFRPSCVVAGAARWLHGWLAQSAALGHSQVRATVPALLTAAVHMLGRLLLQACCGGG